jgi:hypothetical protein
MKKLDEGCSHIKSMFYSHQQQQKIVTKYFPKHSKQKKKNEKKHQSGEAT